MELSDRAFLRFKTPTFPLARVKILATLISIPMQIHRHRNQRSWGHFPDAAHSTHSAHFRKDTIPWNRLHGFLLPYGMGRSYGDSCLNDQNTLILTRGMDRCIEFDSSTGLLHAEAGITFDEILRIFVPQGFFLPVTPGTKLVTLGGAIANDVHGKNHHASGTLGHHIVELTLLRSTGERLICSSAQNSEMFFATIGGMGLTGLIISAKFRLRRINNPGITQEVIRMDDLEEFFALSAASEKKYEFTMAWIDCLARGDKLGRGLFIRGNHAPSQWHPEARTPSSPRSKTFPIVAPNFALNSWTLKAFNFAYYHKQLAKVSETLVHFDPFFYPLDSILHWNRIYGSRGFLQYQCVVPYSDGGRAIRSILEKIAAAEQGSFLAVLKTFGDLPSVGMMSFPRKGVTLALDFPNVGERLFALLDELDNLVREVGGCVYLAKDARVSPSAFRDYYPEAHEFSKYVDPRFSSQLWRRVEGHLL